MARKSYIEPPMKFNLGLRKYEVDLPVFEKKRKASAKSEKLPILPKIILITLIIMGILFILWILFGIYEYLAFLGKFGLSV